MSVIDEALKKTQSALYKTAQANGDVDRATIVDPVLVRGRKKHAMTLECATPWAFSIIAIIVLCIGMFCFHQLLANVFLRDVSFYRHLFYRTPPVIQPTLVVAPIVPQPLIASIPLSLDGTMTVNKQRIALINHRLYRTGQMIDELQIKQIHYSNVILENPVTHEKRVLTPMVTY